MPSTNVGSLSAARRAFYEALDQADTEFSAEYKVGTNAFKDCTLKPSCDKSKTENPLTMTLTNKALGISTKVAGGGEEFASLAAIALAKYHRQEFEVVLLATLDEIDEHCENVARRRPEDDISVSYRTSEIAYKDITFKVTHYSLLDDFSATATRGTFTGTAGGEDLAGEALEAALAGLYQKEDSR